MSNLQPNCCLEFDFRKVDQHAGGKWLIHDTKRRKDNQLQSLKLPCRISKLSSKMWHKGVRWHRIESNILKEGPGTKTTYSDVAHFILSSIQQIKAYKYNSLWSSFTSFMGQPWQPRGSLYCLSDTEWSTGVPLHLLHAFRYFCICKWSFNFDSYFQTCCSRIVYCITQIL